ncbi:MAG: hypothetical protein H6739_22935 [Alphaproteobacteria bacterium]|nr:hypothetical protein [Alphaproteobacteria bacterium]
MRSLPLAALAALLTTPALAQELPVGVESLKPVLFDLGMIINKVESEGYQITDISVGIVYEETEGESVPVDLLEHAPVLLVGMGDGERLNDLDLKVFDDQGALVAEDEMPDNMPVVAFEAPRTGTYDARMVVAEASERYRGGFFALVSGYASSRNIITVTETYAAMWKAVDLLEADGYQVLHAEWETLGANAPYTLTMDLPGGVENCRAVATASGERARALDLEVHDQLGNLVDADRRHGALAVTQFGVLVPGAHHFTLEARKLKRRVNDTHAMVVVACQGI